MELHHPGRKGTFKKEEKTVTQCVMVYGFGSSFKKKTEAKDVDLLITHKDIDQISCSMAIRCKRALTESIPFAHITILSEDEEKQFNFINSSQAIFIGYIRADHITNDLKMLSSMIQKFLPNSRKKNNPVGFN